MAKTYKIFISHSWSHVNDLKSLETFSNQEGTLMLNLQNFHQQIL